MPTISIKRKWKVIKNVVWPAIKNKPYMSHLWVTRNCNIHCKFCYVRDYSGENPSLPELNKRLDKLKEVGCRLTVIMGGEPTLRKDLPEIVDLCRKKDILSYLVTNGTLLTRELMDKLGATGLDVISISFDALEFKDNLLIKYGKSYECDPREKLDILKYAQEKYDIIAFVAICITKYNVDEILELMSMAQDYDLAITLTVMTDPYIIPENDTSWKEEKQEVLIRQKEDEKKLLGVIGKLRELKKNGVRIIEPDAYFERMEKILTGKKVERLHCKAGKNFLDINIDGRIMLCVIPDPVDVHYSELTAKNVKKILKPHRDKQLSYCSDKCLLAAYYDTSYYGDHVLELLNNLRKIY